MTFSKDNAFLWQMYSVDFGWVFNYFNAARDKITSSLFIDIGAASSSLTKYIRDSLKILDSKKISSLKGFAPYANFGYKFRVTNWLDIYASYNTSLLYNRLKHEKKNFPSFRILNLGLNLNIARHYSYQY